MRRTLKAGAIAAIFDGADLRYLRIGAIEILRRVYFAVRDPNWATLPVATRNLQIDETADGWRVAYDSDSVAGSIDFTCRVTIEAKPNFIRWRARGEARTTFLKNRIGWCVLHPTAALAGHLCEVEHVDGRVERLTIARDISPHQPFVDMRALRHAAGAGWSAELRFSGDVFEIEDQRNWSDASFKIYSTPLRLPLPAPLQQGDVVEQSVELRVFPDDTVRIAIDSDPIALPEIRLLDSGPTQIPAGTPENFAELNRNRPDSAAIDGVSFAINPQVHASDDATLVENLSAQADLVRSARRIAGGKRVIVGPVTLGPPGDPRLSTWFAAAWALGSLKHLAEARADVVTFTGFARAFLDQIDPVAKVLPSRSTDPLSVESLVLRSDSRTTVYLANFTSSPRRVDLPGPSVTLPPQGWSAFEL